MRRRVRVLVTVTVVAVTSLVTVPGRSSAASTSIVVSQVFGGGGNTLGAFQHDFIELFNRGEAPASVAGWSLQYSSATGTGLLGATTTTITPLPDVTLPAGGYLLVQEFRGSVTGLPSLPTPNVIDPTPINLSAVGGKVALVSSATPLGCNGGTTACSAAQLGQIVDLVGWGGADFFEGTGPAPGTSNQTGAIRLAAGCTDTDHNETDVVTGTPDPRNSFSPPNPCPDDPTPPPNEPVVADCGTGIVTDQGVAASGPVSATDADGTVISLIINSVTPAPASGGFSLTGFTPAGGVGGTAQATLEVGASTSPGTYAVQVTGTNSDATPQTGTCQASVEVVPDLTPPTLTVSVTPTRLWPPNHKYVTVTATTGASDDLDAAPVVTLVSVVSGEPDDAPGDADGSTVGDVVIVDDHTFKLRAERSEVGPGRTYTITYMAQDAAGNVTSAVAVVRVPLNPRG
jgi:hypothetical protein